MEDRGKVLAVDLGEKRIGLAVSDETRTIAGSYGIMARRSRREDFERYAAIVAEEGITLVVFGFPITLDGQEGQRARWVEGYAAELAKLLAVPVILWDERFSTKQAAASLRARGKRGKKVQERIDAVAAAFILQDYLDAHPSTPAAP
ncbi:MAG: Holliday junction resolvase RuvX [Candidatus Promineifilaceae bacterium]